MKPDPEFPILYRLRVGENHSPVPNKDPVFATAAHTSPQRNVDGNW